MAESDQNKKKQKKKILEKTKKTIFKKSWEIEGPPKSPQIVFCFCPRFLWFLDLFFVFFVFSKVCAIGIGIIIFMKKYACYLKFTAVSCKKPCKLQLFTHIMHTKKHLCEHPFCIFDMENSWRNPPFWPCCWLLAPSSWPGNCWCGSCSSAASAWDLDRDPWPQSLLTEMS